MAMRISSDKTRPPALSIPRQIKLIHISFMYRCTYRSATEKVSERKCSEYTRNGCIMHTPQIRISVRLRTLKAFIMIIIIIIMVITNEGGGDDEDDGSAADDDDEKNKKKMRRMK